MDLTSEHNLLGRSITSKYTIVALCLSGSVEYELNLEKVKASAGMRITFPHVSMMTVSSITPDFRAKVLLMADDFAFESCVGIDTDIVQVIFNNTLQVVDNEAEWQILLTIMSALEQYQEFSSTALSSKIGGALFRDIVLLLGETEGQALKKNAAFSTSDSYFRDFINLLNDQVRTQHEVAYYADQLHISAKYLGEICKLKSGRKAKEIISAVLISQLKHEIAEGTKSMKAIAFEYGFSDQSSLGKFFRKMVGVSPLAFKHKAAELAGAD